MKVYIDDLVVSSKKMVVHLDSCEVRLTRLRESGLKINLRKGVIAPRRTDKLCKVLRKDEVEADLVKRTCVQRARLHIYLK